MITVIVSFISPEAFLYDLGSFPTDHMTTLGWFLSLLTSSVITFRW